MVALSSLAVSVAGNEARDSVSLIYICGPGLYSRSRVFLKSKPHSLQSLWTGVDRFRQYSLQ